MPHRPRTPDEQAGPQAGLVLLLTRVRLALNRDSIRGFDVREARAAMQSRREQLSQEKRRTQQLLRTFLHVRTTLGGAMPSK